MLSFIEFFLSIVTCFVIFSNHGKNATIKVSFNFYDKKAHLFIFAIIIRIHLCFLLKNVFYNTKSGKAAIFQNGGCGDIEVPESSNSTPTTVRKVWKF